MLNETEKGAGGAGLWMRIMALAALLIAGGGSMCRAQINADQVMRVGINALYFDDFMLSIQYFNRAIEAKPYLAKPYFYRAVAKLNLDDYRGAEADATEAINRNPYLSDAYEVRGVARQNLGRNAEAIADYDVALSQLPDNRGILFNKSLAQDETGDHEAALATLNQLIEAHPGMDNAYTGRAKVELSLKDTVAAIADLNKSIELNPNAPNPYLLRADIAMRSSQPDFQSALTDMDHAIKLQPRISGFFINRAFIRYNLNDWFGAMADFDYAVTLDPTNTTALFNRGLLRAEVSDNDRAVDDFTQVLAIEPDNVGALYNRGRLYREKHDYRNALADLDRVIALSPEISGLMFERSGLLDIMGRRREAMADYDRGMAMARNEQRNFDKLKQQAAQAAEQGAAAQGITQEADSGSDSPAEDLTFARRFTTLLTTETELTDDREYNNKSIRGKVQDRDVSIVTEPDFTVAYYSAPTELSPTTYYMTEADRVNATNRLPMMLRVTNNEPTPDDEKTLAQHFNRIQQLTGRIAGGGAAAVDYFARGMEHFTLHDYEQAANDFASASGMADDFGLAYFMHAVANHRLMLTGTAPADVPRRAVLSSIIDDYEKMLAINPNSPIALFNLGNLYLETEDLTSALSAFNRAIELKADFGEAYYNRGYVYFRLGNKSKGTADLSRAGELGIIPSYNLLKRMSR